MTTIIRPVEQKDASRIVPIYNNYLGKATLDTTPRQPGFFVDMMNKLGQREMMLVAEWEGILAGYGILKKYSWKLGYYHAGEISIFLDDEFTGKGIGKELMDRLIGQAKEWEYRHLVSRIMAENNGSILFHKKLGYEMVGIQKEIGFANGQCHDVAILQLILH